jgi:endonuclease G
MGNPTGATTDVNYPANYLLDKPQFCASYNRDKGISNWVAWQLNSTWCNGPAVRKDNFIPDATLPSSWYHVVTGDYTGSGFSRGHMCPSADRLDTQADNDALFVMTNMVPQNQNNNGGIWESLETYERTLANAGNVLYIYSGGYGSGGTGTSGYATTIASGKVTVPAKVWKVIMVLPAGTNDVSRVTTSTRCIAVIMDNADPVSGDTWGAHRVSVDAVEALTGFDFFSNVPVSIQAVIEAVVDNGPTQ